jgi:hypothetical protein
MRHFKELLDLRLLYLDYVYHIQYSVAVEVAQETQDYPELREVEVVHLETAFLWHREVIRSTLPLRDYLQEPVLYTYSQPQELVILPTLMLLH